MRHLLRWWRYGRKGVRSWIVPELERARRDGWRGEITRSCTVQRTSREQAEIDARSAHVRRR